MYKFLKNKKSLAGSLTVETSIVLPVFLAVCISLISILGMISLYSKVEYALLETAREIAFLSYPVQYSKEIGDEVLSDTEGYDISEYDLDEDLLNPILSETVVRAIFTEKFGFENLNNSMIKNGEAGIFFFRSSILDEEGNIDLIVTYKVDPLFNIFGIKKLTFCNRVKVHAWIGYVKCESDDDGEYVYITENASCYHTNRNCSHLNISVNAVLKEEIDNCRNSEGKKYKPCQKCAIGEDTTDEVFFYITPTGESYHVTLSCGGLKRTVYKVKYSEVSDKKLCERCAKYLKGIEDMEDSDGPD